MRTTILFLFLLLVSSCTGVKYFEGRIVYEKSIGPGRDSSMYAALNFPGSKTVTYVGNGNKLELHQINELVMYSVLFLAEQNKTYIIWPNSDTITYYDNSIPENGIVEEFILTDSSAKILEYNCSIYKFQDKPHYNSRLTLYYVNEVCDLESSLTKNSKTDYINLVNSKLNAYPLKIVYIQPGSSTLINTATEIKIMDTDSIFERYRRIIYDHPLKIGID